MGGAVVGRTEDASAVFYNPANMVELPAVQTMAGVTFIAPSSTQALGDHSEYAVDDQLFTVPHVYATWQATTNWWFGLGAFPRFGLGTRFDQNWPGRYNNVETELETFSINPSVAYRINDQFSVAAGVEAMHMSIELVRMLPPPAPPVLMDIEGDSWGYGGDLALSWKPSPKVGMGLVYRLPVRQQIEGTGRTPLFGGTSQDAEGTIVRQRPLLDLDAVGLNW